MPRTPPFCTLNTAHNPDPAETYNAVHPRVRSREVWPEQLERQQADKREHARPGRLTRRVWKDKHCFGGGVGDDAVPRSTRHAGREREERGGRRRERRESVNSLRNRRCRLAGGACRKVDQPSTSSNGRHKIAIRSRSVGPRDQKPKISWHCRRSCATSPFGGKTVSFGGKTVSPKHNTTFLSARHQEGELLRRNSAGEQCGETARRANRRLPPRKKNMRGLLT